MLWLSGGEVIINKFGGIVFFIFLRNYEIGSMLLIFISGCSFLLKITE
jgi:hypothetical protein